jgi:hypothetical protein
MFSGGVANATQNAIGASSDLAANSFHGAANATQNTINTPSDYVLSSLVSCKCN